MTDLQKIKMLHSETGMSLSNCLHIVKEYVTETELLERSKSLDYFCSADFQHLQTA